MKIFHVVTEKFIEIDKLTSKDSELKEATFETYARYLGCKVNELMLAGKEEFGDLEGYSEEYDEAFDMEGYTKTLNAFDNLCYQSVVTYDYVGIKFILIRDYGYECWFTSKVVK